MSAVVWRGGLSLLVALLSLSCARQGADEPGVRARSVLLVVADTLRADHLTTYGYSRPTSPHVDRLAATGVVFENAFVPCNFSGGSYASLFTGLLPHHHGVRDHPTYLADELLTLGEVLEEAGYRTFGRYGHRLLIDRWNYRQGFEDWKYNADGAVSGLETVSFLSEVGDAPFFAFLQLMEPHWPYTVHPGISERFATPPPGFQARFERAAGDHQRLMFDFPDLGLTDEDALFLKGMYDGEIAFVDGILGQILETLDRTGRRRDTIVIFLADHGEEFGEHGPMFNHDATLYDPVLHIPLVLSNPELFPGPTRISRQVREIDLFATVLDLLGLDPRTTDGLSLLPLVKGNETGDERLVLAEGRPLDGSRQRLREDLRARGDADPLTYYRVTLPGLDGKWRCVRDGRHKLIHVPGDAVSWELYDLVADPGEKKNLYDAKGAAEVRLRLGALLSDYAAERGIVGGQEPLTEQDLEALRQLGYLADDPRDGKGKGR